MIPEEAVLVMKARYDYWLDRMERSLNGAERSYFAAKADAIDDLVLELRDRGLME